MIFSGTSRFRVIRLLGSGSTGSAYLVHDRQLDDHVAIKILNQASGVDLYRFKREFRSLVDLRHPNLIALHELFFEGELWFFTMEYVDGVPFNRFLSTPGAAASQQERLRTVALQLCEGVHAMHEAGAIHRDLKPSNVLVTAAGRVVILDFGLAKQVTSNSLSGGGLVGTPTHMAPEQATEEPCTSAADWYAVGSMIYEALTGRPPFQGGLFEILIKKQTETPVDPRAVWADADPDMSELCMQLMHRDPAQRPVGVDVLARLGSRAGRGLRSTGRHPAVGSPSLGICGRERELELLAQSFAVVGEGELAVSFVHGASGIGKTSLVEAFLQSLPQPTSVAPQILRARCHERETLPFKAFDSVVDELSHRLDKLGGQSLVLPDGILLLAEIFPVLRRIEAIEQGRCGATTVPDARESRNQAFVAFRELLVRLARMGPLVIFIDDLQWADRDSFGLLRAVLQQPGAPALHLILAARPSSDEVASDARLRELAAMPGVNTLALQPLPDAEIRRLANHRMADTAVSSMLRHRIADGVASEARGNPFFALELVQHFLDLILLDGAPAVPADSRDYRLDGMILKRVGGLPEEGQRMLEIVSVARDPLAHRTLASAVGVAFGDELWKRGLSALVDGHLVSCRGLEANDTVVVHHDRIAEAVVRHLDRATLRKLHRQLAEAVERWDPGRKDKLARYWMAAEEPERAKRYSVEAATEARSKLAFDRAAELYETAISIESDEASKVSLLRALGDCRAGDGHAIAAASAYQRAAAASEPGQSLHLRHLAAEQLLRGGHITQGLEILQDVLRESGLRLATGSRRTLLSVVWRLFRLRLRGTDFVERPSRDVPTDVRQKLDVLWSANIGLGVVDILRADDFLLRFILLALDVGDLRRVAQGLAALSGQLAALGASRLAFARRIIAEAEVLARRSGDAAVIGLARMCKGVVHYFAGEWNLALGELLDAEDHFLRHCHGVGWELATARSFICFTLRALGRARDLCERYDRYTSDADRVGDRYLATNLRTYMSIVWQIRGDVARARKELEGVLDFWPSDEYQVQHFFHLYARCELSLYEDQPEIGMQAMVAEQAKFRASAMARVRGLRGEYAWITGKLALAMAEKTPCGGRAPLLRRALQGARYLRSLDQHTAISMGKLLAAAACWLSPHGDRNQVATTLEHAIETLDAVGATSLAATGSWWLAEVVGGSRASELRARSERWLVEQGVREPSRFFFTMLPGFRAGPAAA